MGEAVGFFDKLISTFDPLLDPIFGPILKLLGPIITLVVLTLIITIVILLIHKKFTNQEALKRAKEEAKDMQHQMKEYKNDPQKVMELQRKMLERSMSQFRETWKPLFITFIPIALLYGWLALNVSYYPIMPDIEFTTTIKFKEAFNESVTLVAPDDITILDNATKNIEFRKSSFLDPSKGFAKWKLKGKKGSYELKYKFKNLMYNKELEITDGKDYKRLVYKINDENIVAISIDNVPVKVLGLHWFWAYIIMAFVFNIILRKVLHIY